MHITFPWNLAKSNITLWSDAGAGSKKKKGLTFTIQMFILQFLYVEHFYNFHNIKMEEDDSQKTLWITTNKNKIFLLLQREEA